jgi:single-strand DNA-binding protein
MAGINKVILIGNVGRDPETRFTQGGKAVTNFSIATTERYNGEDQTEWHNIVLWGSEGLLPYITKGKQLYIEGKIQTRKWDGNDGQKHYKTEIVALRVQLLGGRNEQSSGLGAGSADGGGYGVSAGASAGGDDYDLGDIGEIDFSLGTPGV